MLSDNRYLEKYPPIFSKKNKFISRLFISKAFGQMLSRRVPMGIPQKNDTIEQRQWCRFIKNTRIIFSYERESISFFSVPLLLFPQDEGEKLCLACSLLIEVKFHQKLTEQSDEPVFLACLHFAE